MHNKLVSLVLLLAIVSCYAKSVHKGKKDEEKKEQYYNTADFDVIYDQKQNASENYRLDISGVNVVIAPPANMLQAFLSPLSVLALLEGFSKKSALPMLKKNFGSRREGSLDIDKNVEVTTGSTLTSAYPNDVVESQKTPLRDFTKNFEEKIQVQELLPGFKEKNETKNSTVESTKKSEIV